MHEQLHKQRHSLAHIMAMALLEHDPDAKLTIGPAIDTGFYYDVQFSKGKIPNQDDLKKTESRMRDIIASHIDFTQSHCTAEEARQRFQSNAFKLEIIDEIVSKGEALSLYTSGTFTDLCNGPHVTNSNEIAPDSFILTKTAGAYWRGDENREQLTRVYGLAFSTKQELDEYLTRISEAEKRDHRKIGKELDLFTFSDLVGSGLPLFTPNGTAMRDAIVDKISSIQEELGYQRVWIPHITKCDLYKTSGHWEKFGDELFKVSGRETEFVMKPMNCPHHTQIYASSPKSYKDLPVRFMEATTCYRDEQTGELLGLSRVRALTQDDGHVFCTPDQIETEIKNIISVIKQFYSALGMWKDGGYRVFLSARDPKSPEKYLGGDEIWNTAESILKKIAEDENLPYTIEEGEAAFYGPKLDFKFKDAIGREWQLATAQLDFNMPARFGLEYTDSDGKKKTPVMIHRAVAGSLERFLSIIIEHFAGEFPFWLAPIQIAIIPVSENHIHYTTEIAALLSKIGIRIRHEKGNEGLGKKVRAAKNEKIPYYIIVGDKEVADGNATLESREGEKHILSKQDLLSFFVDLK